MISKVNELLSIGYGKLFKQLKPVANSSFHAKMMGLLQTNATVVKLNEGKDPAAGHPLPIEKIRKSAPIRWPTADEINAPINYNRVEE